MNHFNVEEQFQNYLKKSSISLEDVPALFVNELRRAYFACAGQMLASMNTELPKMGAERGIAAIKAMGREVVDFFEQECEKPQQIIKIEILDKIAVKKPVFNT